MKSPVKICQTRPKDRTWRGRLARTVSLARQGRTPSSPRPLTAAALLLIASVTGCVSPSAADSSVTQPVTAVDPKFSEPTYWLDQPAFASVNAADFDAAWAACEGVAHGYLFPIDRRDPRSGVLVTQPTVSGQWFEPWRHEQQQASDVAESSVASIRRTMYFRIEKSADGFTVTPKVLVERQSLAERRVTSLIPYKTYFRRDRGASGTRETDMGLSRAGNYWYPTGRDELLERKLAGQIEKQLRG